MSKLSKKLILSVLTLVLTVVALGATTFAWFTLGNKAVVGDFGGTVTAGDGLEIRLAQNQKKYVLNEGDNTWGDADITGFESWYTSLPSSRLEAFLEEKYNEAKNRLDLKGLTTEDGISLVDMNKSAVDGRTGAYIEFELEVRSQNPGYVYVTSANLEGKVKEWLADTNHLAYTGINAVADKTKIMTSAAYAARLSLEGENVFAYQKGVELDEENPVVTSDNGNVEDNDHVVTVANTVVGVHNGATYAAPQAYGAHDYFFKKNGGAEMVELVKPLDAAFTYEGNAMEPRDENNVVLVDTQEPISEDDAKNDAALESPKKHLVELTKDADAEFAEGTITVRVWIEGWDNEAYNAIFNFPLFASFSLYFVAKQ